MPSYFRLLSQMLLSIIEISSSSKTLKDGNGHETKALYLFQGPQGIKGAKGSSVSILQKCLFHKKQTVFLKKMHGLGSGAVMLLVSFFDLLCLGRSWSKGRKGCARTSWTSCKCFTLSSVRSLHLSVCPLTDEDSNLLPRAHQVKSSSLCPSRGVPSPSVPLTPASCSQRPTQTCPHLTPLAPSS